jgi:hypothetical protein
MAFVSTFLASHGCSLSIIGKVILVILFVAADLFLCPTPF